MASLKILRDLAQLEKDLSKAIEREDKDYIKFFIGEKLMGAQPFEQLSVKKLREIRQYLSIENYFIMNKLTLVEEINNVIQRIKSHSNGERLQPKKSNHKSKDNYGRR